MCDFDLSFGDTSGYDAPLARVISVKVPPFSRVAGVMPVHRFLQGIGAPAERIAKRAGLSTEQFDCPDALIPFHPTRGYFSAAARAAGIPNLGALAAFSAPVSGFGSYGHALFGSPTLYDAVRLAGRLLPTFCSAYRAWYLEDGERIWFCERYSSVADDDCAQLDAFTLATMVNSIREIVGADWRPDQVRVPERARTAINGIDTWADTEIEFTGDLMAVAFPRRLLSAQLPDIGSPSADDAITALRRAAPPRDFLDAISAIIRTSTATGPSTLNRVAAAAGTSARSLQRRFAASNVTFSDFVARTRLSHARDLLRDPEVKTIDVAFELGYSDPANFTRAFRRWTGVSPREYRVSLTDAPG